MKIASRIRLKEKAKVEKDFYDHDEVMSGAEVAFNCNNCKTKNQFVIRPYQTGVGFAEIYENSYLVEKDILGAEMASKASSEASYLGGYLVHHLPTLYHVESCCSCAANFIAVFGIGEQNPNRWVCKISGVWGFE